MDSIQVNTLDSPLNFSVGDTAESSIPDQSKLMNAAAATTGFRTTGPVAVLEDADPWGYNSVEDILNTYFPIELDVIPSASFGTSLTKYQKVIISSRQSAAFYSALETYRSWIESYVWYGGVLEVHAATYITEGEWILPFDFGLVWNITENVEIADPTHYVLNNPNTINGSDLDNWGNSAHGYFNNTDDASIILTDSSGEPVLIEQRFGLGYIFATSQPVEYAYGHEGYTDLLENMVWYMPTIASPSDETLTGSIAVLQDIDAWDYLGVNATQDILIKYGINYDIIDSTYFGTADLSAYQKVIISSVQGAAFYTALGTHKTWLEDYVSAGGILEVHAATQGTSWTLPGNIDFNYLLVDDANLFDPYHYTLYHPYWIREPDLYDWNYATHGYFTNTAGSSIILTNGADPVLVEKAVGDGFVIATGQTVEWAWHKNYSYFLENLIFYIPHQLVSPQPDDYLETYWDDVGGDYYYFNFTFGSYLDDWRINTTATVERFHSDDVLYANETYWFSLTTRSRALDDGTMWWVPSYFILMLPSVGLTVGSVVPMWSYWGYITEELDHVWVNGLTYECWNISWWDGGILSYAYVEKTSGVVLFSNRPGYYNMTTLVSSLVPQPPTVMVTSPNGGEELVGDVTVTWDAMDVNQKDVLTYNLDYWDGSNWVSIVTGLTATTYDWDTTGLESDDYKVRVTVTDGRYTEEDESDAVFSIDNDGPTISNVDHSPSSPTAADTINVTAEITDLSGIKTVELLYTINGGSEQGIAMAKVSGDTYAVDFPVNFALNDAVEYYIKAVDNNNFETESTTKSFTVAAPPGIPGFSLAIAILSLLSCGAIVYLIRRKRR